jgi:hypothetical protein
MFKKVRQWWHVQVLNDLYYTLKAMD